MVYPPLRRVASACLLIFAATVASPAFAQAGLPPEVVPLDRSGAFRPLPANWTLAADLAGDPRRDRTLAAVPGSGLLVCNPDKEKGARGHLFTAWDHGDIELDLEFLLPPGSNSGVYLQGRYEIQLADSWGKRVVSPADCGGVYDRWDAGRGAGKEAFGGTAPSANAARAPGLWQKLRIEFQAPRFDAAGKKTADARFLKVVLNGHVIHENVTVAGPTRSAAFNDEQPLGPLMIQGDHGPVALRRLATKRFEPGLRVAVENLAYKLYTGPGVGTVGAYDRETPKASGPLPRFTHAAVEKSGRFALVVTGRLVAPRPGVYRFSAEASGATRLLVDGRPGVVPADRGGSPGVVTLAAGAHDFRLDLVHATGARPALDLFAEGPGVAPHALTVREEGGRGPGRGGPRGGARQLLVEPAERPLVQRGFVPFEPRKRLYAASVGTPAGVHFAYDFETGAVLRAWRGRFVDTFSMWDGRGNDQLAKPAGPALTFHGKPTVAHIEYARDGDWPDRPETLWSSQGYVLGPDGIPVFLGTLSELAVRDRLAPDAAGRGLVRTLQFSGKPSSWSTWLLLAEAAEITPQPGGAGWIIGDREWFLDWPADSAHRPVLRAVDGRRQLAVPLAGPALEKPLSYSIVW